MTGVSIGSEGRGITSSGSSPPGARRARYRDVVFDSIDVQHDLRYAVAELDGREQELLLDVYEPRGDGETARPAVLYLHGGDFLTGDKDEGTRVATDLASRGYVVASANYRLYRAYRASADGQEKGHESYATAIRAATYDARAAVRWLRDNAGRLRVSPGHLAAMGWSAGGIAALQVAVGVEDEGDNRSNPGRPSRVAGAVAISGRAYRFSAGAPPILMCHGEEDRKIPIEGARQTVAEATKLGIECELIAYPGVGHDMLAIHEEWMPHAVTFLAKVVSVPSIGSGVASTGGERFSPAPER